MKKLVVFIDNENQDEYDLKDDKQWSLLWDRVLEIKDINGTCYYYSLDSIQGWKVAPR